MREIKSRYWNAIHQEFIQDCDVYHCPDGEILVGDLDNQPIVRVGDSVIASQYTGLKDKNGVEMYEGDILSRDGYPDMQIVFANGCFVGKSTNKIQALNWQPSSLISLALMHFDVVGNIHQNPELLNQT